MLSTLRHSEKDRTMENEKISGWLGIREGRKDDSQSPEAFQASETITFVTIMVSTCHDTCLDPYNAQPQDVM
jgi:hypothetical protein